MAGFMLLQAALLAFAGRGEQITVILDRLFSPTTTDATPYYFSFLEVSDQITVADLIEKANWAGKVYYDDWDYQRYMPKRKWASDGGDFLNVAYGKTINGPYNQMYDRAFYGGRQLRPTSTLASNGVKERSTILLTRVNEASKNIQTGADMSYVKVTFNGKNEYIYFYRGEDMWNLFNVLSHRYGQNVDDVSFDVEGEGVKVPNPKDPRAVGYVTLGKIEDDTMKNPFYVKMTKTKVCTCMTSGQYQSGAANEMTKRLLAQSYGLGCKAHDENTKVCGKKNIKKGNRECWCPKKWCYVQAGCGSPSVKFPGLSFSYDICSNRDAVDCFASDDEGVEGSKLGDFDIWTFPKVTGYLRQMATVLVDSFPILKDAFEEDE